VDSTSLVQFQNNKKDNNKDNDDDDDDDNSAEELYRRAPKSLLDIQRMRSSLSDFEDRSAGVLRQMIMARTVGRADVMKLALSLRAARLQFAAALPSVVRQRIAVETLQVWAPLSFQVGLSAQVPELEVHSYVLLFPQSFNSFLGWFDCFRPLARKLLRKFRESLQVKLQTDLVLPSFASKVTNLFLHLIC
jgi:(p)ppGpp synthase/HD superfamily hydrolase